MWVYNILSWQTNAINSLYMYSRGGRVTVSPDGHLDGLQYFPLQVYPWIARVNPYSVLWAECLSILFFSFFLVC